jgi:capsular polysaccharide biosynthesis protein
LTAEQVLKSIWRMKLLAVLIVLVFVGISAGITMLLPQTYNTTATLRVEVPDLGRGDPASQQKAGQDLARTYTELLKSPNLYKDTVDRQELSVGPAQLRAATNVSNVDGTELIQIKVERSDPAQASSLANAVAQNIVDEYQNTDRERLVLADPAPVPLYPTSPSLQFNMILALLLGTVTSVVLVLMVDHFRSRRHTSLEKRAEAKRDGRAGVRYRAPR